MRIDYLTEARLDEPTAPAHHVLGLCRALSAGGHRVRLVHPSPRLQAGTAAWLSEETVRAYPRMRGGWRLYERSVASWLRRGRGGGEADVLYLRLAPSRRVANALRPLPSLKVLEVDGTEPLDQPRFGPLLDAVDLVLGQAGQQKALQRAFSESFPGAVAKLALHSHPATDPEHFRPLDRSACRSRLGLPRDRRILLHVSSFQAHHDLATAVEALRRLSGDGDGWVLILAGDGPARAAIRRTAANLVESGRLRLPGFVSYDELPLHIGAADICLNLCTAAKLREGNLNGFKCLEYLAGARPVIESVDPGLPVPAWASAVVAPVPPQDPAAVAGAALRILADPAAWEGRCAAGRSYVLEERTWGHAAGSTLRRIAAARRSAAARQRPVGAPS